MPDLEDNFTSYWDDNKICTPGAPFILLKEPRAWEYYIETALLGDFCCPYRHHGKVLVEFLSFGSLLFLEL